MTNCTLYHRALNGGVLTWGGTLDGTTITLTWGYIDGAQQTSVDPVRAEKGKTAEENARLRFERAVLEKRREGYVEHVADIPPSLDCLALPDWDTLPNAFAPAKPVATPPKDLAVRVDTHKDVLLTRKRDGMRHFVLIGPTHVGVFTRGLEDRWENYPELVTSLGVLRDRGAIPAGTLLDLEIVVDVKGADDFLTASGIARSDGKKARLKRRDVEFVGARLKFYLFDVLFFGKEPVWQRPYERRLVHVFTVVDAAKRHGDLPGLDRLVPLEVLEGMTLHEADEMAARLGWEGLVAWDLNAPTRVLLTGKPVRTGCWKVLRVHEDDFIATGWERGIGKFTDAVGGLVIEQRTPAGRVVDCGKVGTGFNDDERFTAKGWAYPCVVKVSYAQRDAAGMPRFPVFVRRHTDKAMHECVFTPREA